MRSSNQDIKKKIKDAGVHQYQIADILGVSEATLVRWLRYELTDEQRNMIFDAIEKGATK